MAFQELYLEFLGRESQPREFRTHGDLSCYILGKRICHRGRGMLLILLQDEVHAANKVGKDLADDSGRRYWSADC